MSDDPEFVYGATNLKITYLGGQCPVQAEGTVDGVPFYFRARHRHWTFTAGADPLNEDEFYISNVYGTGPHDAGYMPEEVALGIIRYCADVCYHGPWRNGEVD